MKLGLKLLCYPGLPGKESEVFEEGDIEWLTLTKETLVSMRESRIPFIAVVPSRDLKDGWLKRGGMEETVDWDEEYDFFRNYFNAKGINYFVIKSLEATKEDVSNKVLEYIMYLPHFVNRITYIENP